MIKVVDLRRNIFNSFNIMDGFRALQCYWKHAQTKPQERISWTHGNKAEFSNCPRNLLDMGPQCLLHLFCASINTAKLTINDACITITTNFHCSRYQSKQTRTAARFRTRKAVAKSQQTLWLRSRFIHKFLIWPEILFIQEVAGVYTSRFLNTDYLNMALQARNVSGAFEKRDPGHNCCTS